MRILFWGNYNSNSTPGAMCSRIAKHLSSEHNIDLIATEYNDNPIGEIHYRISFPLSDDKIGQKLFARMLTTGNYDCVWIDSSLSYLRQSHKILWTLIEQLEKKPVLIWYIPVTRELPRNYLNDTLKIVDYAVAQSKFGYDELIRMNYNCDLSLVEHGIDTSTFFRLKEEIRKDLRKTLKVEDDEYLLINVNENVPNKQLPHTIFSFSHFLKVIPNAKLYLYTNITGQNNNLIIAMKILGIADKVIFPSTYSPSDNVINNLYNASDCCFTTSLDETGSYSMLQAMAAGTPIVGPCATVLNQVLERRAYTYACKERTWANDHYWSWGRVEDIVQALVLAHKHIKGKTGLIRKNNLRKIQERCSEYVRQMEWKDIMTKWDNLFRTIQSSLPNKVASNSPETPEA